MGFKKYAKRQVKRLGKYAKKRYAPTGKIDVGKVVKDVMWIKGVLNTERKYLDTAVAPTTIQAIVGASPFWSLVEPDIIPQGNSVNQRNGNSVRIKSLQLRGTIRRANYTAGLVERVRMIVFVDKEPLTSGAAGSNPLLTDLYQTNDFNAMRNWDSQMQKRFKIVYSRNFVINDDHESHIINVYKKMNMVTKWTSASTIGDAIQNNKIYIAFMCDTGTSNTQRPQFELTSRVTFVDN